MNTYFFESSLILEVNVIGYKDKGESIVFFVKADEDAVFSGLVDCYEKDSMNKSIELLCENNRQFFDFVCWTHPHKDHTVGLDKVINEYCNSATAFWMPPFTSVDIEKYSKCSMPIYSALFDLIKKSPKSNRMRVRPVSNASILTRKKYQGVSSFQAYNFEIRSFAPDSELIASNRLRGISTMDNLYSVGLILIMGNYYIMLAGDIENPTIKAIPDENIDYPITYIKIPHHGSDSADYLILVLYRQPLISLKRRNML